MQNWHVLPVNDLYEHQEDEYCPCNPVKTDEGSGYMFVHNSYDGREHNEPDHQIKGCDFCVEREIAKYSKLLANNKEGEL